MDTDGIPSSPRLFGPAGMLCQRYHYTKCFQRSLGLGMAKRKGNNSLPSLMASMGSIQSGTTSDPIKSPGVGQLVTTVVRVQGRGAAAGP